MKRTLVALAAWMCAAAAGGPPARLGDLVKRELPRWARVVKAAGIKAD